MCIDLHTHSLFSDGSSTPLQLVELAMERRITALALTDHDTMDGVEEIMRIGHDQGMTVLSGVEISAQYFDLSVHLLGYGIDPADSDFHTWLGRLQEGRAERNDKILNSLQQLGVDITQEELQRISSQGLVGRPHFAHLLINKGIVGNFNEAFRLYLGKGRTAWHRRFCYTAAEAITAIHRAGGIAVLAHPGQIDPEMKKQPALVRELALYGLDGIEVYYPSHSKKTKKQLGALASTLGLIKTGGSDYHGATRPANDLAGGQGNFCPPDSLLEPIRERIRRYQQHA